MKLHYLKMFVCYVMHMDNSLSSCEEYMVLVPNIVLFIWINFQIGQCSKRHPSLILVAPCYFFVYFEFHNTVILGLLNSNYSILW